ncbi:MAG: 2-oxoacid:acceptor oxidoreductase subunit alpha [Candidatus Margulisiibacteriota bacterium]
MATQLKDEVSVVLSGEAGQGVQAVERLLTRVIKQAGYHVFAAKEYMSRVRGGTNSTSFRISSRRVDAFIDRIDLLIQLDDGRTKHLAKRISAATLVLAADIFNAKALELGNKILANVVAAGVVVGLLRLEPELLTAQVKSYFAKKSEELIGQNVAAALAGIEIGRDLLAKGTIGLDLQPDPAVQNDIILSGAEAIALGALAGGCNFVAAYPMTPSTGIFTYLAQHAAECGLIAEQAEDEIAAINMALGAWYAGARAIVATAGGGFALMVEGISLSGMLETPVVVSLGQRPAPATGLPTRTEQGDLNFALYSGHGEFPRIILAPGSLDEAFDLSQKAFNLADKFQVPVIILSDQYLADSYYNIKPFDLAGVQVENNIIKTAEGYQRYKLTADGLSPRGVPGYGDGLVGVDSDEHDETGHITEDLELRAKMVDKRLAKMGEIMKAVVPPLLIGSDNYQTLVVGWGSNRNIIAEALKVIGDDKIAFLHFSQVYPLPPSTREYLVKAKKVILIENNATGQFGQLIKLQTGYDIQNKILKYNGLPFSVEELVQRLRALEL